MLKQATREVDDIDGAVAELVDDMIETMHEAPGTGLAEPGGCPAPDLRLRRGRRASHRHQPAIVESEGEWAFEEGCLSVPGLSWQIVRPNRVHLVGVDLDGHELSIEADTLEGRVFQHELDHLDGVLLVDRLDDEQRREAKRILRSRVLPSTPTASPGCRPAAGRPPPRRRPSPAPRSLRRHPGDP